MSLTVTAPEGAHFALEELATKGGADKFSDVPILVWDDFSAMVAHFTEEGVKNMADGTSLRVAYQSIARRGKLKAAADDEIAKLQVAYQPGKRTGAPVTPQGRAAKAAKALDVNEADEVTKLIENLKSGKLKLEDLAVINS